MRKKVMQVKCLARCLTRNRYYILGIYYLLCNLPRSGLVCYTHWEKMRGALISNNEPLHLPVSGDPGLSALVICRGV